MGVPTNMVLNAVIFDFVGTLIEETSEVLNTLQGYYEIQVKAIHNSLKKDGISTDWLLFKGRYEQVRVKQKEKSRQTLIEYDMRKRVSDILTFFNYRVPSSSPIITRAVDAYMDLYLDTLQIQQSTYKILKELKSEFNLGVVTNFAYPLGVYKTLDKFALRHYFRCVVISGEVGWKKPSRHIFDIALSKISARPEKTVFVGDDYEADIIGAKRAGMKTIFLGKEPQKSEDADVSIKSLREITSVIKKLPR